MQLLKNNFIYGLVIIGLSFGLTVSAWSYSIEDDFFDASDELNAADIDPAASNLSDISNTFLLWFFKKFQNRR